MTATQERSVPKPAFTDAEAGAKVFPDSDARHFNYFTAAKHNEFALGTATDHLRAIGALLAETPA